MKKLVGLLALFAVSASFLLSTSGPIEGLKVGDKAPDFKLQHIDGNFYSLAQLNHQVKGYIVAFTCNTCPYAKMYEDRLKQLHTMYADKGYPVIAVMPNDPSVRTGDSFEAMKERYYAEGLNYMYLYDEGQKVFPQYGATKTPEIFLLDKEMTVRYIGAIDDNPDNAKAVGATYLQDAVNSLMAGKEITVKKTKAIGCSIKVKPENKHLLKKASAGK